MGFLYALLAIAVVLVLVFVLGGAKYRRIFAPAHVLEIGRAACHIRSEALTRVESPDGAPAPDRNDPRSYRSSLGVTLFYSVTRRRDTFLHHFSLSYGVEYPASAVGHNLCSFLVRLYQWPADAVEARVSPNRVFHVALALTEVGMNSYSALELPELTPELSQATWKDKGLIPLRRTEESLGAVAAPAS